MYNHKIVKKKIHMRLKKAVSSLVGVRSTIRYQKIEVVYFNDQFKKQRATFTDFTAQIIQHEIDHCKGILI